MEGSLRYAVNAIYHGRPDLLRARLEAGLNPSIPIPYDIWPSWAAQLKGYKPRTLLHLAARLGKRDCVELLLEKGLALDLKDGHGRTALLDALSSGHEDLARHLIELGSDVRIADNWDGGALHYWARGCKDGALLRLLLDKGLAINARDKANMTPLHVASAEGGASVEAARLLLDCGADLEARDEYQRTPLLTACSGGKSDIALYLLERGADAAAVDSLRDTALHKAVKNRLVDVMSALISRGADVDARDEDDQTPLHKACEWSAEEESVEAVRLLVDNWADINKKDKQGKTPLMWACEIGKFRSALYLIDKGADITVRSREGETALHVAARRGEVGVVAQLLNHGANIHAKTHEGDTPLHLACKWAGRGAENPTVRLLVERGAAVDARDGAGNTPALGLICQEEYCEEHEEEEDHMGLQILKALVEGGADLGLRNWKGLTALDVASKDETRWGDSVRDFIRSSLTASKLKFYVPSVWHRDTD